MAAVVLAETAELEEVIQKMEEVVREFAANVAELFASRCTSGLYDCYRNNYHHCLSTLPNAICPASEEFVFKECNGCGAPFDFTTSTVHLTKEIKVDDSGNPTDPKVIESICYSRQLDRWFKEKHENTTSFLAQIGVDPPQMFVGHPDGTFRIFPGRHNCSDYDPRERPWYVAASSGPKNIMLVLDTSGSMADLKLDLLKKAAKRVVNTLTVRDRIGVVRFSDNATSITPNGRMLIATEMNKKIISDDIDKFEADGETNFDNAFKTAFAVINSTMEEEGELLDCNSAILFLTDGQMTEPENLKESDLISQLAAGIEERTNSIGKPVLIMTFSVSEEDDNNVHRFPKNLACATEFGVWSKITDPNKIVESLENYYKLFALGLGQGGNQGVAWVEPYSFFTGGVKGTTVSAPVYDEFGNLVAVVGIDFTSVAINKAAGFEASSQEALDYAIKRSTAYCPSLNLSFCAMESIRGQGAAGSEALCYCYESQSNCTANCTEEELINTEPVNCSSVSDHPDEIYDNTDNKETNSAGVVCCDETDVTSQCRSLGNESNNTPGTSSNNTPGTSSNNPPGKARNTTAIIIGGVLGGTLGLFLMVAACFWYAGHIPKIPFPVTEPDRWCGMPHKEKHVIPPLPPPLRSS